MIIIGVTGTLGAGKGEVVSYFKQKGFAHFSVRSFLLEEMGRRGIPITRDNMTSFADDLRKTHSPSYLLEQMYYQAVKNGHNAVLESVRALGELDFLRTNASKDPSMKFYLVAVDADPKIRYERIVRRKSALDNVSFEQFIADEKREMGSSDPNRGNISKCIQLADITIVNEGSLEDLHAQMKKAFQGI